MGQKLGKANLVPQVEPFANGVCAVHIKLVVLTDISLSRCYCLSLERI